MSAHSDSLCVRCVHLSPALDPNIQQAFLGKCLKREWPFTLSIPLEGWKECDFFEDSGRVYVPPAVVAPEEAPVAEKVEVAKRLEFYYSSQDKPGEHYFCDNENALRLVEQLRARGLDIQAIDVSQVEDVFPIYHRAVTGPSAAMRPVFGAKGALEENFGRTVPALLIYKGDRYPEEVYPRMDKELGRVIGVEEALERELPPHVDRAELAEEL